MENKNYGENRANEKSLKKHLFLFLKNNILLAGAVFAFILLTAAWFVNNSRVPGRRHNGFGNCRQKI